MCRPPTHDSDISNPGCCFPYWKSLCHVVLEKQFETHVRSCKDHILHHIERLQRRIQPLFICQRWHIVIVARNIVYESNRADNFWEDLVCSRKGACCIPERGSVGAQHTPDTAMLLVAGLHHQYPLCHIRKDRQSDSTKRDTELDPTLTKAETELAVTRCIQSPEVEQENDHQKRIQTCCRKSDWWILLKIENKPPLCLSSFR